MLVEKKIKVPIFGYSFNIIVFDDNDEFDKKFEKFEMNVKAREYDGGVFEIDGLGYLVLRWEYKLGYQYPTPGIIAHESKHMVNAIFEYIHQNLDTYNDEVECYLLTWIVNRVHEFVATIKK